MQTAAPAKYRKAMERKLFAEAAAPGTGDSYASLFFMSAFSTSFSTAWKKGEQMDFRGGGIHGIKAGAFFYYHSIINRKQTQNESKHKGKTKTSTQKQSFILRKMFKEE